MKTTVDIPDDLLQAVMKQTGSKTIRGAIVTALEWFNHRERQREAMKVLGTFKDIMTRGQLRQMRDARDDRHDARGQQFMGRSAPGAGRSGRSGSRRKSA